MANRWSSACLISVGQVFGKYTVIEVKSPSSLCRCVCGKETWRRNSHMLANRVGGCHGCANKRIRPGRRVVDSSLSKEDYAFYAVKVRHAIGRCTDSTHTLWKYYGGRGIKVCQEWLEDPNKFLEHLLSLPGHEDRELVLDRIDNNQGYKPGNMRFVTKSLSQQNKGPYGRREYAED